MRSSTRSGSRSRATVRPASVATKIWQGVSSTRRRRSPGAWKALVSTACEAYIRTSRQHDFVTNMSGKLLAFALGRSLLITDEPTVEDITRKLAGNGYRFSGMIESIVTSRQFLTRRGEPADTDR